MPRPQNTVPSARTRAALQSGGRGVGQAAVGSVIAEWSSRCRRGPSARRRGGPASAAKRAEHRGRRRFVNRSDRTFTVFQRDLGENCSGRANCGSAQTGGLTARDRRREIGRTTCCARHSASGSKQAMRAKDARTLSTVRMILARSRTATSRRAAPASRRDPRSGDPAHAAGHDQAAARIDRALPAGQPPRTGASRRSEEIAVIESFLPKQMSEDEIDRRRQGGDRRDRRRRHQGHGQGDGRLARAPRRGHRHGPRRRGREAVARVTALRAQRSLSCRRCEAGSARRFRRAPRNARSRCGRGMRMAFPPGFLDELRARVSLAELVGRRVRLTRRGREYSRALPVP